jgi:hypothetical protein
VVLGNEQKKLVRERELEAMKEMGREMEQKK